MDKSNPVFPFLLTHADKGDLEKVKQWRNIIKIKNSVKPLMMLFQRLHVQDLDIARFFERTRLAIKTLDEISGTGEWVSGLDSIIASYFVDESEWTKEMERMKSMKEEDEPEEIEQNQGKRESGIPCKCLIM